MRTHGVQRRGKAADVVKADEFIGERHAVHLVHIDIPRQPDGSDKENAAQDVHAQQLLELTCDEQIEKYNPAREHNADRSLRHHRETAGKIHQPILTVNERKERRRHKEQQRTVGHRSLAHIHEDDARPHDNPRPEPCARTEKARRRERRHEDRADRHERSRKTRRQLAESAEQLE